MTHEKFIKKYLKNINWHIKGGILYVDEDLDLAYSKIKTLPKNIIFNGFLNLDYTKIKILPENMKIKRFLGLNEVGISLLPKKLCICGFLNIRETQIISLPTDIIINGSVYTHNKITMSEKIQLSLISQNEENFKIIQDPTEKAITMHNLLWGL